MPSLSVEVRPDGVLKNPVKAPRYNGMLKRLIGETALLAGGPLNASQNFERTVFGPFTV